MGFQESEEKCANPLGTGYFHFHCLLSAKAIIAPVHVQGGVSRFRFLVGGKVILQGAMCRSLWPFLQTVTAGM